MRIEGACTHLGYRIPDGGGRVDDCFEILWGKVGSEFPKIDLEHVSKY
jgi:hypothetical protein